MKKRDGFNFGSFLALVGMQCLAHAQAAPAMSLPEALRYAVDHSPTLDAARRASEIRALEHSSAFARLLPSVDLTATHGLQNNIPIAGSGSNSAVIASNPASPWYSNLNLGVTERLYDNGASLNQLAIARVSRELAELRYAQARDSLALELAGEYYRYSLARVLLETRRQQEASLRKQLKTLTSQYHQGFKTKSDYLRLNAQTQRSEIDRISAENSITQSVATLRKILGVSSTAAGGEEALPEFLPLAASSADQAALSIPDASPRLDMTFEARLETLQREINDRTVSFSRREYWPRVSVSAGAQYINLNYLNSGRPFTEGQQLSWNALLTVEYNLWDWGIRRRAVEIAEHNRGIQDDSVRQTTLDAEARVTALMGDLARIRKSLGLSRDLLSLEEDSNRNLESQYREGKVTYLDLITGLNSLLDARVQYYTAYFDAHQAQARYRYFEGRLYESIAGKTE